MLTLRIETAWLVDFDDRFQKSQNIVQIDVLSMTDLAVNNRKMRIDLASQVFSHTIIDATI